MTYQDMIIGGLRAEIKRLNSELATAKAMLHRLSQYVSDEDFAQIALEMTMTKQTNSNSTEDFWRGE